MKLRSRNSNRDRDRSNRKSVVDQIKSNELHIIGHKKASFTSQDREVMLWLNYMPVWHLPVYFFKSQIKRVHNLIAVPLQIPIAIYTCLAFCIAKKVFRDRTSALKVTPVVWIADVCNWSHFIRWLSYNCIVEKFSTIKIFEVLLDLVVTCRKLYRTACMWHTVCHRYRLYDWVVTVIHLEASNEVLRFSALYQFSSRQGH